MTLSALTIIEGRISGFTHEPPLKVWKGDPANTKAAQEALYHRAKCNGLARSGEYSTDMEK